jgi:hypothetical protein
MYIKNSDIKVFEKTLKEGNVSFFLSRKRIKPIFSKNKEKGIINYYSYNYYENTKLFEDFSDISRLSGDVCFLEKKALRCLTIGYPYRAKYVLFRPSFSFSFLISIPGFLRRLYVSAKRLNSKIFYLGWYKLKSSNGNSHWIVLKNTNSMVPTQFTFDEKIGIKGLINFLNTKINDYVVIRFFEKLPSLYREGGDIDMIVSDDKWDILKDFLFNNPGTILIDMYGVSKPSNGVMLPYYPPKIARQILQNSVIGPGGAKVPNNEDYLLSFIYHCVYHKGYTSGIKSVKENYKTRVPPDNDYNSHILNLGKLNGIDFGSISLEMLDKYMDSKGWRPQTDTLSFIGLINPWLNKHIKESIMEEEIGLSVIILKKKYKSLHEVKDIHGLLKKEDFLIVDEFELKGEKLDKAIDILRGGNWLSAVEGDIEYLPWYFMIIKDNTSRYKLLNYFNIKTNSIRLLKNKLRNDLDVSSHSIIHATDNTSQAIEYINLITDDFVENKFLKKEKLTFKDILKGLTIIPIYLIYSLKKKSKQFAVRIINLIIRI